MHSCLSFMLCQRLWTILYSRALQISMYCIVSFALVKSDVIYVSLKQKYLSAWNGSHHEIVHGHTICSAPMNRMAIVGPVNDVGLLCCYNCGVKQTLICRKYWTNKCIYHHKTYRPRPNHNDSATQAKVAYCI